MNKNREEDVWKWSNMIKEREEDVWKCSNMNKKREEEDVRKWRNMNKKREEDVWKWSNMIKERKEDVWTCSNMNQGEERRRAEVQQLAQGERRRHVEVQQHEQEEGRRRAQVEKHEQGEGRRRVELKQHDQGDGRRLAEVQQHDQVNKRKREEVQQGVKRKFDDDVDVVEHLRKKLKHEQQKTRRLTKQRNVLKNLLEESKRKQLLTDDALLALQGQFSESFLELIKNELDNKDKSSKGFRYSKELKRFALSLHFHSPDAYNFLKDNGIHLPEDRTLRNWRSGVECEAGYVT